MPGKKAAKKLDAAAAALYKAGTKVGGKTGGRVGDAVANATMGALRRRCNTDCTQQDCNHS